jgi:hypothetical protein
MSAKAGGTYHYYATHRWTARGPAGRSRRKPRLSAADEHGFLPKDRCIFHWMDPVTLIVAALAAGAAAGMTESAAAQVVKGAYSALKARISARSPSVDFAGLERRPESEAKRNSLAEDLAEAGVAEDPDVIALAERLVAAVRESSPAVGEQIGVDLADVEAQFVRVRNVTASGTAVRVRRTRLQGGIDVEDVHAGKEGQPKDPR